MKTFALLVLIFISGCQVARPNISVQIGGEIEKGAKPEYTVNISL